MKQHLFFFILTIGLLTNCTQPTQTEEETAETDQLGKITYDFKGAEEAQPHFKKGLLLMHNFEYKDARESFLEAQKIDSKFVMAFWGEAMTFNHPLWREQEYENGQEALKKLAETPEERLKMAASELEKDFLSAVEILYGEGTKYFRDSSYSEHLGRMYEKYKGNHEVASFYALSILGAVPVGRDETAYEKSTKVVEGIIAENPEHPGALHYMIHSNDDPKHAHLALNAANAYSKVAADAAHALHMPSHIYVSVGMWDEVISSNIASWNASVNRKEAKELDNDALSYHALHWRMYGHLNKGEHEKAKELITEMSQYMKELPSKVARRYFTMMRGNYVIETNDWQGEIANMEVDDEDLNVTQRSVNTFIKGMQAFVKNDMETLANSIATIETELDKSSRQVSEEGLPMCSAAGSNRYIPNQADIDNCTVMLMELKALQDWKSPKAEEWLKQATDLEAGIYYSFGPPYIPKPSFELYGQWLIENKRPEDAVAQFEKALERGPKRMAGLKGRLQVAEMTGDETTFHEMMKALGRKS